MPKIKKIVPFVVFVLLVFSACTKNEGKTGDFVTVSGKNFILNGKPYHYVGTNMWYGANLGALAEGGNRQRLIKELDLLQSLGINNIRVMGASEGLSQYNTVDPPIQPELGKYNEKILEGLDFLLAEMGKRNLYAVIYLNNYWVWTGGMAQYVSWLDNEPIPNPFLKEYEWWQFMKFSARFYSHKEANKYFRQYLTHLLTRTNTVTGIKYIDDPTIMSWQLANEPRPGVLDEDVANFPAFLKWIDGTAKFIKNLDPNHLVSTGNEGLAGSLQSDSLYKEMHRFNSIDYMTAHLWLLNWQWYNPLDPENTYPEGEKKALAYLDTHIGFANELNKPLVFEEFGIPRDKHSYDPTATTVWRDRYFKTVFQFIYDNSKSGGPLVGSNFWAWGGYGKARETETAVWKKGDDFTGDPPQEPQGRNSVFAADKSTIDILKKYSKMMLELNK